MKKNNFLFWSIILVDLLLFLVLSALLVDSNLAYNNTNNTASNTPDNNIVETPSNNPADNQPSNSIIPLEVNLDVPFTSQAPGGDWSGSFEHTCEEASVLMVHYYLAGEKFASVDQTKKELLDIVNFENQKYGFSDDTDTEQTARFARDYYSYNVKIFYDITLDDIKNELAAGNPVIVPTDGRLLGNPNYTGLGPLYHMLVIKGYTNNEFITNDAGTRNGADYKYSYEVLGKAIHDWGSGDVLNGRSAMIVITK